MCPGIRSPAPLPPSLSPTLPIYQTSSRRRIQMTHSTNTRPTSAAGHTWADARRTAPRSRSPVAGLEDFARPDQPNRRRDSATPLKQVDDDLHRVFLSHETHFLACHGSFPAGRWLNRVASPQKSSFTGGIFPSLSYEDIFPSFPE